MPTTYGPFTVVGNEVKTGANVNPGDSVGIISTGLVNLGGGTIGGIGAPVLNADGDDWTTPSDFPAPKLRKNSLICKVAGTWYQGGTHTTFSPTDSGEVILAANDWKRSDNTGGWKVWVYHATAGQPNPVRGEWFVQDVDSTGANTDAPSVAPFKERLEAFESFEYAVLGGLGINGLAVHQVSFLNSSDIIVRTVADDGLPLGGGTSAVVDDMGLHVFFREYGLRHASSTDGVSWQVETVDGKGGSNGQIVGNTGVHPAAIVHDGKLQVFYTGINEFPNGDPPVSDRHDLRRAVLESDGWHCETLDGRGGSDGRITGSIGKGVSVVSEFGAILHVFYYDGTKTNLRHAWFDGQMWRFETLDGSGDPNPGDPPDGQTRAAVGSYPVSALIGDTLFVFYHDESYGNVRVASKQLGQPWRFEKLDGGGGPNGRAKSTVGNAPMAIAGLPNEVGLFYWDSDEGHLRHAWKAFGSAWAFEVVDGTGGPNRVQGGVGRGAAAILQKVVTPQDPPRPEGDPFYYLLHVFYVDDARSKLRHAQLMAQP